jgi:hypothetical protein
VFRSHSIPIHGCHWNGLGSRALLHFTAAPGMPHAGSDAIVTSLRHALEQVCAGYVACVAEGRTAATLRPCPMTRRWTLVLFAVFIRELLPRYEYSTVQFKYSTRTVNHCS